METNSKKDIIDRHNINARPLTTGLTTASPTTAEANKNNECNSSKTKLTNNSKTNVNYINIYTK